MVNNNSINPTPSQKSHSLVGLILSQFMGAFNDNAWKLMVFTLATRSLIVNGVEDANFDYNSQMKATLALMVFLIPMLIFSLPAGALADRYSKRTVMIAMKALEVFLMAGAVASLYLAPVYLFFPYVILGLLGAQSALFSPAKYGILPQILPYEKLSKGNGTIEMWTMISIIAGTGLGPLMLGFDKGGTQPWLTWTGPFFLAILSAIGFFASFAIPKVPSAREESPGVFSTIIEAFKAVRKDRILLLAISGTVLFWLVISLLGQNVLVYAKALVKFLEQGELFQGIPPASYGIGIAIGALLGGRLSGDHIEYGLIPFGAICFAITSIIMGILQPAMPGTVVILILMGAACGMLIVPLQSIVQWRAPGEMRGAVIALGNIFNILGMICGSLVAAGMAHIGLTLGDMLVVSALLVVAATIWSVRLMPEALVRLVFIILTTTFYKIRIINKEYIPKEGGALLLSNHLSASDAFFVIASIDRPIRFMMSETHYNKWWLRPFAMAMDAIPVPYSSENPAAFKKAMHQACKQMKRGHIVCMFPEGQVSRTGTMQPFREGIEEIIQDCNCPIIPVNLDRVWGTIFSPVGGRYLPRRPQNIPHPLTVSFGKPLACDTPIPTLRNEIRALGCDAWMLRKEDEVPIYQHFIRSVWRGPLKMAFADESHKKVTRLTLLCQAIALARMLRPKWKETDQTVGILLPSSMSALLANLALSIAGKTIVNLNYSASQEDFNFFVKDTGINTLLTSKSFFEKQSLLFPRHLTILFIEDFFSKIDGKLLFSSGLIGLAAPMTFLQKICGNTKVDNVDDILTILYTSGCTTPSQGVKLSHFNISSNIEGVAQVVPSATKKDKLLHTLPLFHSFGYMTMWLGLNHGIPLVMHSNPLDAIAIGKLVKEQKVTMLWTTPTFLNAYTTQVPPEMFGSLRFVLTGAEKLVTKHSEAFNERFGIRPVESYGTTECSPIIATSTLDIRLPGIYQTGSLPGSVGQPLPGVMVRIVDPDSFEELPLGTEGLLLVKGPNVMQGYANRPDLTKLAMQGEWYITNDIAVIDENEFIIITDRIARFSKINGEMIAHTKIEEVLHNVSNTPDHRFVVTTVPSEKGESLAIVHTAPQSEIPQLITLFCSQLSAEELSNFFIPTLDHFIPIDSIPLLATGKVNFRFIKQYATEHLSTSD